jgi:two-component system response regulator HydG
VAVNCASLPSSLLESELFGHVRGAFTGASAPRRGLFVEADGGTLLLDEIGDMPLELQPHLLRVLEDRQVRPVGADAARPVDVRVLAATHQPLEERVAAGKFRADLYYRLDVLTLRVPPLRERVEDLPELFAAFVSRSGSARIERLSSAALAALERYPWPGNVRELENLVRRLAVLVERPVVERSDLEEHAPRLVGPTVSPLSVARTTLPTLRQLQDDYIAYVVAECGGNKTRAAEILGIDVSTIHRRERSTGS